MVFDLMNCGSVANAVIIVFSYLITFILATPFHECAHGYVAYLLGDRTAKEQGRLSMNPIVHLDLVGTIGLFFMGIGWAKPVPVNPHRAYKVAPKAAMAFTAAAGPASNFILALAFMLVMKIIIVIFPGNVGVLDYAVSDLTVGYIVLAINLIININLRLGVFNLILPIPPFDGSRIFLGFLPEEYYFKIMRYERYIMVIVLVLLNTNIIRVPFGMVSSLLYDGINFITSFIC